KDYKYYLSVIAASRTKEAHKKWSGWIGSRVRLLVKNIDESEAGVECARPHNKEYERIHRCKDENEVGRVVQGNLDFQVSEAGSDGTADVINGTKMEGEV